MQTATFLGVLLAALFALLVVLWQYYFRPRNPGRNRLLLAILRFLALFGTLILLVNPKITRTTFSLQKQNLVLLMDDSESVRNAGAAEQAREVLSGILRNEGLSSGFEIKNYSFGQDLAGTDSLSFTSEVSDISGALSSIETVYGRDKSLVILATDGNQTFGKDYEFMGPDLSFPVYPMVLGDTTKYQDLKITQVNANKYVYLNNSFPLEIFVAYQGKEDIRSRLTIKLEGERVFRQDIDLSPGENSKKISTNLKAGAVGSKTLEVALEPVSGERNTVNNQRRLAIEVIDERTQVGIVSELAHPDIGALIKAIESNQQRSVSVLTPQVSERELSEYDLLILYQPGRSFDGVYRYLERSGVSSFTLTGPGTDWTYLNRVQKGLEINSFNETEEVLPVINPAFSLFDISDFSVDEFPPLLGTLGEVLITRPYESILDQQIKGVVLQEPLLSIISEDRGKQAYLFGQNIWKWRIQSYRNDQDFENFDRLINKIVFYLTSDGKRDRLTLSYEPLYTAASERTLKVSFYDATYVFDRNAGLKLDIRGIENEYATRQDMILSDTHYEADLRGLPPGAYNFAVSVEGEGIKKEGRFRVEDFNLEQLFVSSDNEKLQQLAEGSGGALFYPGQLQNLIAELTDNPRFSPTQKSVENVVSLIDFKVLLGVIVLALSLEWFIRKYIGLI